MVVVIIAREFAVTSLRSFAAAENLVIPAGLLGQGQDDRADRLHRAAHHPQPARRVPPPGADLALGGGAVTVYSGVEYFVRFGRLILRGALDVLAPSA